MSSFEFIAVLLSIIFALAIANLLSGMLQAFLRRELTDTRLAWSIIVGNLLLLDWWVFFGWSDHTDWRFHEFLYLAIWATLHYLMAVSLYPYQFLTEISEELQRKSVLASIIALGILDIGEKIVRGDLFEPWFYLLMILYVMALATAPLVSTRPWVMRASGWVLAASMLTWSVVVRGVLAV
jgi:hypothetical protein